MIFILSCFDLAAVIIVQPVLILSTILWSMETNNVAEIKAMRYTCVVSLEVFPRLHC